ncbi:MULTISPECIES: S-type pyocin domain-containing protein [Pseudomonas]|uniref:Pyosin/cloacin translocation domain-containing protein n=1 Tax=Pseudomonas mosselii TaxID=78327 RepID=A0A5R8ZG56_9PSED|nr:S-type pyocin domain-containing protein [Pseudomonas mosselii]TLP64721.1 hypothetical protein FEM01_00660 [Pseudomonas mosselii]
MLSNSFDPGATDNAIRRHHAGKIGVAIRNKVRQAHEQHILLLENIVTEEVEAELSSASGSELEIDTTRQQVLQRLITEKQSELSELSGALSKYFNFDPVSATDSTLFGEFIRHAGASLEHSAVQSFTDGLYTAYDAKTLAQVVQLLQQQEQAATATVALLHAQNAQQVAEAAIAEAIRRANSYSAIAVSSPVIVTAAGTVITNIARFSLLGAIQAAIGALVGLGAGVAAGLAVGTIAMLVPSRLGNGELPERYLLQTPLDGLDPDLSKAMASGNPTASHADLPFRFGSRTTAAGDSEIFVVKTDGQTVPAQVRILAATHDPQRNVYSVVTADIPSRTLTWTPIAQPPDASTTLPAERPEPPVYEGATLTPVEVRIDSYPEVADASLDDYVIVFPAESGIPPLYVVFSSPYPGATTRGKYSGRPYNPDESGGPIEKLDWRKVTITQAGVDLVKIHTSRFNHSDANGVMLDRLLKILQGTIEATDTDRRFYTHEIRELERYRRLGIADNINPPDDGKTWNNTHTATLEDYALSSDFSLLYTPEAIEAEKLQLSREDK